MRRGSTCAVSVFFSVLSVAAAAQEREPIGLDPTELVAVCEGYGRGYFYVPGTSNCLRVGGYVRYLYNTLNSPGADGHSSSSSTSRFNLELDSRRETDFGTLRSFGRVQYDYEAFYDRLDDVTEDGGNSLRLRDAYIQLGTTTVGYLDSLWTSSQNRMNDGLLTATDWSLGRLVSQQITYNDQYENLAYGVSVESNGIDYLPNLIGKVTYRNDVFGAYASAAYETDSGADGFGFGFAGLSPTVDQLVLPAGSVDDGLAVKAGMSVYNVLAADSELRAEATYAFDPTKYAATSLIATAQNLGLDDFDSNTVPVRWAVGLGYKQRFGKLGMAASVQHGRTFDFIAEGTSNNVGPAKFTNFAADVSYDIVENLTMQVGIQHRIIDVSIADFDQTAGFVRWTRRF